ncbi:sugar O-acetyltransferase [Halomonas eurihalina]|uniref:Acetyltransferase n=1 Tax=Halomonas eurihalina TaxID=42566 RepID=A0A5D9D7P4_HALER|nr:sugar O-acetyltransferase [Halomonas eurihalina]MDR5858905.1 sugar O-acetyltransferase [Halomonas eurihalina]TZG39413.1 sugar O-acetyltransferase [Halomonas eurihalina]
MTEREKMLASELYDPRDAELQALRRRARLLTRALNDSRDDEEDERARLLRELIPNAGPHLWVEAPFYCDYGCHIWLGENVFFNFNCVVLDVAPVTIGDNVLLGPGVQLYTATHPLDAKTRRSGQEAGRPIAIGDDCWLGGGAIINPGVSVGPRSVIGAGSVVTSDIPADVFAAGNPCRVIRKIENRAMEE